MRHLENARDKVLMGPERKARLPDEEANKITAFHEGGHAIVAHYTKVSLVVRFLLFKSKKILSTALELLFYACVFYKLI